MTTTHPRRRRRLTIRVECNDLAASRPDLVKTLAAEWDAWAKRANVDPWVGPRRLPWGDDAPRAGGAAK